ncbi:hypothetical protein K474DRAFT_1634056 [Panus rudis PR-1116 ss-1]|nr:hypothetical protein K474DRAFT_1634056 [Panus rudis PR-1116 ss-1]
MTIALPDMHKDTILNEATSSNVPIPSLSPNTISSPAGEDDGTVGALSPVAIQKKKKKSNKTAKSKEMPATNQQTITTNIDDRPPVLCISRNKHWRYISSYHGPWLQLPAELLESLLILNLDPATLSTPESRTSPPALSFTGQPRTPRARGFASVGDHSCSDSSGSFFSLPPPPSLPPPKPGKTTPPPIDPGVFKSITHIRRLIDEASELSVRASSGLSAVALGSMRGSNLTRDSWNTAHILGINGMSDKSAGRQVPMSATRIHKLRVLAVQKLAAAYQADEIASSVMVMQGGSVFDDIAERVLRVDPHDIDARYVHFFHEKIPSRSYRQLAESTSTRLLDELIVAQPHRLEFYRTRGIVHCFRDEYALAVRDFTHVIRESRTLRKVRAAHRSTILPSAQRSNKGKRKKKGKSAKTHGQAPPDGTGTTPISDGPTIDGPEGEPILLHPSALPDAPDPIEPQCLFLRGAAYLQHAVHLVEEAILQLEGVRKTPSTDGGEIRLCYIDNGKYGGVEIGHPDGPLGSKDGAKVRAYREVLADPAFRQQVTTLVGKSLRDHEKFLSHFDTLEHPDDDSKNIAEKTKLAFLLCENLRPNGQHTPPPVPTLPITFSTYHPLLVESYFSVLLCKLMLGDFLTLVPTFCRTAQLVEGLEGYPIFLPPRSMAQAEFIEVLERLAGCWKNGVQPHSLYQDADAESIDYIPQPSNGKAVDRPTPLLTRNSSVSSEHTSLSSHPVVSTATIIGATGPSSSTMLDEEFSPNIDDFTSSPPLNTSTPPPTIDGDGSNVLALHLDYARILLVPVAARQKEKKAETVVLEKTNSQNDKKKPLSINIPLHGPRVEVLLAWIGAVHLIELDDFA